MNRQGHEDTRFFIGTEVENTPAKGMKTLFVVGVQDVNDIQKVLDDPFTHMGGSGIQHIYFGANHSFPRIATDDAVEWRRWENMINEFLSRGYICTLDIDVTCVEGLLESFLVEHRNFVPMISVKLPYLQQLGYNATIKLDDKDFDATNPGVWCHSLHSLTSRQTFTSWNEYTKDQTL